MAPRQGGNGHLYLAWDSASQKRKKKNNKEKKNIQTDHGFVVCLLVVLFEVNQAQLLWPCLNHLLVLRVWACDVVVDCNSLASPSPSQHKGETTVKTWKALSRANVKFVHFGYCQNMAVQHGGLWGKTSGQYIANLQFINFWGRGMLWHGLVCV